MSFEEKYQRAQEELASTNIKKPNANPPIFLFLHKLGVKVPPPHYNHFLGNLLLTGSFFGVVWGLIMYISMWRNQYMPAQTAILTAACAGLFFGIFMAGYFKVSAKKNKLSQWKDL